MTLPVGCFKGGYGVLDSCDLETPVLFLSLRGRRVDFVGRIVCRPSVSDIVSCCSSDMVSAGGPLQVGDATDELVASHFKIRGRKFPASRTEGSESCTITISCEARKGRWHQI